MSSSMKWQLAAFFSIVAIIFLTANTYSIGVNDAFYFDDHINLSELGSSGGVDTPEAAAQFIFGNTSGVTGRPVSMASFLVNDYAWPSRAKSFKETNIWIHALAGILLFWFVYIFACCTGLKCPAFTAVFVAGVWLLNPLHVSTVLYPVQRMAQLPVIFTLFSLIFFVKARVLISKGVTLKALILFSLVGLSFLLAVYSKENGALIPIFIILIELLISPHLGWPRKGFKVLFWFLSLVGFFVIIGFMIYSVYENGFFDVYPGRDFTPYQRMITEPSVILFYLKELFFPSLYTSGLYYDDWSVFTKFWGSGAALYSLLFIALLSFSIFFFKRRFYSGFALLFFFSGHLLESTVLNLELVFEHRNYLPSLFLGFVWLDILGAFWRFSKGALLLLVIPLLMFPIFTYDRNSLWENQLEFAGYLAEKRPKSVRSHVELNNALMSHGMLLEAKSAIGDAVKENPDSGYLALHAVLVDCIIGREDRENKSHLLANSKENPFDGRNALAFEKLYSYMEEGRCTFLTPEYFARVLEGYLGHLSTKNNMLPASKKMLQIYADRFYISNPEYSPNDVVPLSQVLENNDPEYLMSLAANLANLMRHEEALVLSNRALQLVRRGILGSSTRSQQNFEDNIIKFQDVLKSEMNP